MTKQLMLLVLFCALFAVFTPCSKAFAQDKANNKVGVHILFPDEINEASHLVNSNGGDWGYVTIPIQAGEKNIAKWQSFMDKAKDFHVIPIIRLATEGDFLNTKVWRKPTFTDIVDFTNFLSSLSWPTKTKYVMVFNEPNRADEWGGEVNPSEYAAILSYASSLLKAKDGDYFIISAGMDNASANVPGLAMNEYAYLEAMEQALPGVFSQIDALGSHSYPNPAFAQTPNKRDSMSIATFRFEQALAKQYTNKTLPVFITETGWTTKRTSDSSIAEYYKTAFADVWSDDTVMAVTPFLLRAHSGPFEEFSLLRSDGTPTEQYTSLFNLTKLKGTPELTKPEVLGEKTNGDKKLPMLSFNNNQVESPPVAQVLKTILKWFIKI